MHFPYAFSFYLKLSLSRLRYWVTQLNSILSSKEPCCESEYRVTDSNGSRREAIAAESIARIVSLSMELITALILLKLG
jgi:hypothetical protein